VDSIETVSGLQPVFEAAEHSVAAGSRGDGFLALCWRHLAAFSLALPGLPVYYVVSGQARI